jgi:hypothetical protein
MLIKIGLITLGKGNWRKFIKNIWESLDIKDTGYWLWRANEEYNRKLTMDIKDLPSYMTNYDLHIGYEGKDHELRITISTPIISDYKDNDKMVLCPYEEGEVSYKENSLICTDKIIRNHSDYVIVLCGDNLSNEELGIRQEIANMCVKDGKLFWELGNDCECVNFDMIMKWIKGGENYCGYFGKGIERVV